MTAQTQTTEQPRPTMSAQEAQTFTHHSASNAEQLEIAAALKGCSCQAYQDWYTYKRWRAQGFQVQRGETGEKIVTYISKLEKNEAGEDLLQLIPRTVSVFCRCQVKPIECH